MTDDDRQWDRVESALRGWARRPPRTPAAEAAREVMARTATPAGPSLVGLWAQRLAIAAGVVLVVTSGVLLWRNDAPPPMLPQAAEAPPVLPENVVIFWLDADTPVYFVVRPADDAPGGTP